MTLTVFLVAINDFLGKLGRGVDGLLNVNVQTIYTTSNLMLATRASQKIKKLDAWAAERGLLFSPSKIMSMKRRKRDETLLEIVLISKSVGNLNLSADFSKTL